MLKNVRMKWSDTLACVGFKNIFLCVSEEKHLNFFLVKIMPSRDNQTAFAISNQLVFTFWNLGYVKQHNVLNRVVLMTFTFSRIFRIHVSVSTHNATQSNPRIGSSIKWREVVTRAGCGC